MKKTMLLWPFLMIAADNRWVIKAPFDGSQFTYTDIRDKNDNPFGKALYGGGNA